jgi:Outer membrane lipoprotein-sorting protein
MKILYTFLLVTLAAVYVHAQDDSRSKPILEKVASANNGYKTIKTDFKLTTSSNVPSEQPHSETGKILMKGERYHLLLSNSDITFDGKSIYTYAKASNEINITKPEPSKVDKGDFFFSNPKDIFKGYNKNFKSTLVKETNLSNVQVYEIDLYPIDLKTKYIRIRMHISKSTYQIVDMKCYLKDGGQYLLEFSNFSANVALDDKEFTFDAKKYPNAEINDMRF